jgi:hypothetical protein
MNTRTLGFLTLLALVASCGDGDMPLNDDGESTTPPDEAGASLGLDQLGDALEPGEPMPAKNDKGIGSPIFIATLNIRAITQNDPGPRNWNVRKDYITKVIASYQPTASAGLSLFAIQEAYRESRDFLHQNALSNFAVYSVDRGDGSMQSTFFRPDRFEHLDHDFRNVQYRDRDDLCDASVAIREQDPFNRPISYVHLRDLATGLTMYVFNVHFPSRNSCERKQMAKILARYISDRADKSANIVLLGDFNDGVKGDGTLNDSYSRVIGYTGLRNVFADMRPFNSSSEFTTENGSWNPAARHGRMIDHILVSPGLLTWNANVDHTLFTANGDPVPCLNVTSSGFCENTSFSASSLRVYSDHWANAAIVF